MLSHRWRLLRRYGLGWSTTSLGVATVAPSIRRTGASGKENFPTIFHARFQLFQKCATRLIYCYNKSTHITFILRDFYWFPTKYCTHFQIFTITYRTLNSPPQSPTYLSNFITPSYSKGHSRSNSPIPPFLSPCFNSSCMDAKTFSVIVPKF